MNTEAKTVPVDIDLTSATNIAVWTVLLTKDFVVGTVLDATVEDGMAKLDLQCHPEFEGVGESEIIAVVEQELRLLVRIAELEAKLKAK